MELVTQIEQHRRLFQSGRPYREPQAHLAGPLTPSYNHSHAQESRQAAQAQGDDGRGTAEISAVTFSVSVCPPVLPLSPFWSERLNVYCAVYVPGVKPVVSKKTSKKLLVPPPPGC